MKNNNKKNNNKPNWFAQQRQKFGEEFMSALNPKVMEQGAIAIFKDMSRSNFDVQRDGMYFLNPQFLLACQLMCKAKMEIHGCHVMAIQCRNMINQYINTHGVMDPDMNYIYNSYRYIDERSVEISNSVYNDDLKCYQCWETIYNTMVYISTTGDIGCLVPLIQQLNKNYRYSIV